MVTELVRLGTPAAVALLPTASSLAAQASASDTSAIQRIQDATPLPADEHVEVKQGIFLVGTGDKFDLQKTMPMVVADTGTAPAGMHHYAAAKGATIVSVTMADLNLGRAVSLLWRAIRLRCPNCARGGLWRTWFRMRESCPRCGLHLERGEQGYIVGAQMFNIIAAELLFAAIFVGVLVATLPDPPWDVLQYGGPALMIVFPVFFYPFSKTIFLAFDLFFRPPTRQDFS